MGDGHGKGAGSGGQGGHHGKHHGEHHGMTPHAFAEADRWTGVLDDPERDVWQQPETVLKALELGPAMTVADVGVGTGYFAVRVARALPAGEVIAVDEEPDMLRHVAERAVQERLPNVRTLLATQTASGLAAESVDRILVVHVWHHFSDRVASARDLARALRPGGKLLIVDFSLTATRGPPVEHRLLPEQIIADLIAAGLSARVSPIELVDQYIVEAHRPTP